MASRTISQEDYRFGFNGKENDGETYGTGNALDFGARIYDSRLGRWMSTDPQSNKYPYKSPYMAMGNNPTAMSDPDGEDEIYAYVLTDKQTGQSITIYKVVSSEVFSRRISVKCDCKTCTKGEHGSYFNWHDKTTFVYIDLDGTNVTVRNGETKLTGPVRYTTEFNFIIGMPGKGGEQAMGLYLTSQGGGASPTKFKSISEATQTESDLLAALLGKAGKAKNQLPQIKALLGGAEVIEDGKGIVESKNSLDDKAALERNSKANETDTLYKYDDDAGSSYSSRRGHQVDTVISKDDSKTRKSLKSQGWSDTDKQALDKWHSK